MTNRYGSEVDRQRAERVTRAIEHRAVAQERADEVDPAMRWSHEDGRLCDFASGRWIIVATGVVCGRAHLTEAYPTIFRYGWTPDEVEAYQAEVRRLREERGAVCVRCGSDLTGEESDTCRECLYADDQERRRDERAGK